MKRKFLSMLLMMALLLSCVPLSVSAEEDLQDQGITYKVVDGEAVITGYTRTDNKELAIPGKVGGPNVYYTVTTIGSGAFYACAQFTTIEIPNTVQSIENSAFAMSSIQTMVIPDSVTSIGNLAFWGCEWLSVLVLPEHLTSIGLEAFAFCKNLEAIEIPSSLKNINTRAFNGCYGLRQVTIPEGVETISAYAFDYCSSLVEIEIPNTVTTIGNQAFAECYSLSAITIPDSVTQLGEYAFSCCDSLTSVSLGNGLSWVKSNCCYSCSALTDVYYNGSEREKESIRFSGGNDDILNACWHYAYVDPAELFSDVVEHSVMDTDQGNGLAFRFTLTADNVAVTNRTKAVLSAATVNYRGNDCRLIGMGAVATLLSDTDLERGNVDGEMVVDIPAVYLCDVQPDSCAYFVRIIDIPERGLTRTVYVRPYYIVEVDGEEVVVYGDIDSASCTEYM